MFENEYVECVLPAQKSIALIAHDNKKKDMVDWCMKNKKILEQYEKSFGVMGIGMPPYMMNNQMNYGAPMNNSYMPNQPMQQPTQQMNQNYQTPTDNNGQTSHHRHSLSEYYHPVHVPISYTCH